MTQPILLTINGGSSSIKMAAYTVELSPQKIFQCHIDRIGQSDCILNYTSYTDKDGQVHPPEPLGNVSFQEVIPRLLSWLQEHVRFDQLAVIGHRIVHGMNHQRPALIDTQLLDELHQLYAIDPEHLPGEVALIEAFRSPYPDIPQVACFDTSFHHTLPSIARILPIPRRFGEAGVQRYGFHGLSYAFLLEKLVCVAGPAVARGRLILMHLGSGSSITAVRDGQSIDTSMGFTPAGGLPMSSRSGDLDPGVAWYMLQKEKMTPEQFDHTINHESGLLGISGTTADMQELLQKESSDPRAAAAVAYYCYQVKKYIGAYTAVMGGLDALVFTGGIGENAAPIRSRICAGLEYLGIQIDEKKNMLHHTCLSYEDQGIPIYMIHTDEELMIARYTASLLKDMKPAMQDAH